MPNRYSALLIMSLVVGVSLYSAPRILASAGDLDTSFGNDGKVVTSFGKDGDSINSVILQSDGKIVAGGCAFNGTNYDFGLARYNVDGSLDLSFGSGGKVSTDVDMLNECINGIGIQSDGKIVAGGQSVGTVTAENAHFILVRYNPDGTPDRPFGIRGDGIVLTDATAPTGGSGMCGINAVTIQPDGKIVAVGWSYLYPFDYASYFTLVRYNTSGALDPSFGQGGIVTTGFAETSEASPFSVAVQTDGRIVAAGVVSLPDAYAYALARYNANGSLDNSFGSGGKVITHLDADRYAVVNDIAIQPDGKILAAGYTRHQPGDVWKLATARYKPNGSLDTDFGTGGVVSTLIRKSSYAVAVAIQSNGRFVEAGGTQDAVSNEFALARYDASGLLDASFGTDGTVVTSIREGDDTATAVAIQPDGRIVAAGWSSIGKSYVFALARYMGDAVARTRYDFDGDGRADQSVFRRTDTNWYVLGSRSGFSAVPFGLATDKLAPADFDGDGKTDVAVFRNGTWYWLNSSNSALGAHQFGLPGDLAVAADYSGDGRAELAVYRNGDWYTLDLVKDHFQAVQFGLSTDKPVPADFDGDGRADFAVYRDGIWFMLRTSQGFAAVPFGLDTDQPVTADYDGDGRADPAVYRSGVWYVLGSTRGFYAAQFGIATDIPVPADYDGDGASDIAVFRDGVWYTLGSTQGFAAVEFGLANDEPIPAAYLP